jgi:hypothetical protein
MENLPIISDMTLIYEYSQRNPRKFGFFFDLFKEKLTIEFMVNVVKNEFLAMYYHKSNSKKYLFIDSAISNAKENNVLIYFSELNAYALFDDVQQYEIFLDDMMFSEYYYDYNSKEGVNFSPYQIIFAEIRQKVVILIKGTDQIAKDIAKYAQIYFNNDTILNTDLFTKTVTIVNLYVLNLNEAMNKFKQFYKYVYEIDRQLADYIAFPIENISNGVKFVSYYVGNKCSYGKIYDYSLHLKHYFIKEKNYFNVKITNTNDKIDIHRSNKTIEANNWITKNMPKVGDSCREYYLKYCKEVNNSLSSQTFSPIVAQIGFSKAKKNNIWVWTQ